MHSACGDMHQNISLQAVSNNWNGSTLLVATTELLLLQGKIKASCSNTLAFTCMVGEYKPSLNYT